MTKAHSQNARFWLPHGTALRQRNWAVFAALLAGIVAVGCGPEGSYQPEISPRRGPSPPAERRQPQYQLDDRCEQWLHEAKEAFPAAYRDAERPRLSFVVNVAMRDLAADAAEEEEVEQDETTGEDALMPSNVSGAASASLIVLGDFIVAAPPAEPPASQIDHRAVEDLHASRFLEIDPAVRLVDANVVRENLKRQIERAREPQSEQAEWPCDIVAAIELELTCSTLGTYPVNIICTARAVRLSDGRILATATPEREQADSFEDLDEELRWLSRCSAAELASELAANLPASQD